MCNFQGVCSLSFRSFSCPGYSDTGNSGRSTKHIHEGSASGPLQAPRHMKLVATVVVKGGAMGNSAR